MKNRMISIATFILALMVIGEAQSVTGSYQMHSVKVVWRNFVRDSSHADDAGSVQGVYGTWVVPYGGAYLAVDANDDGVADLKQLLVGGKGGVVRADAFPEATIPYWLITDPPEGIGVKLSVAVNQENSVATIPATAGDAATYPTTSTTLCITTPLIADATHDMKITLKNQKVWEGSDNIIFGFGIQESSVFDLFKPLNPNVHYPTKNNQPHPGTADSSWGIFVGRNPTLNDDGSTYRYKHATIRWHAIDGPFTDGVGSASGVDDDGNINRQLGVAITADKVTIPGFVAWGAEKEATVVAGDYPLINGQGFDHDKKSYTTGQERLTHTSLGGTWDGVGYIFDARGGDGVPFSGDEPLAPTGYYMTANFVAASGAWQAALAVADLTDPTAALTAGATAITTAFGLDNTTAATVVTAAATTLGSNFALVLAANIAAGMDEATAAAAAFGKVAASGPTVILGTMAAYGVAVNDGNSDFVVGSTSGRLLFQVDAGVGGGLCIPVKQTRDVFAQFTNTVDWMGIGVAPVLTTVNEDNLPERFTLHNNYPNPFNPVTTISFDLPEETYTEVTIYNMMGQKVRTLHSSNLVAGRHQIMFNGVDDQNQQLGSGVYFYRVVGGDFQATKKMMFIK